MNHPEAAGPLKGGLDYRNVVIWAIATSITMLIACLNMPSVFTPMGIVPFGNDAFYHASRILDTAIGERGFYQFDAMMHVPEGSWVSWPWAYDRLLAGLVSLQQAIAPAGDPMALLVFIPVIWTGMNMGLLLGICKQLGLRIEFRALVLLGFAFLPTTQTQHRLGQIDHHFIELSFIMLCTWLAMRWFRDSTNLRFAIGCGVALSVAQAFHHALFILQLPMLLSVALLWFKGEMPDPKSIRVMAGALLIAQLAVVVPSGPFLDMQFNMTTLSWFHLYIACCTSGLLVAMSMRPFSLPMLAGLGVAGILLVIPVTAQVTRGADFVAGRMEMLSEILEMQSPWAMISGDFGFDATIGLYSLFIVLVPFLLLFCVWRLVKEKEAHLIVYLVFATVGMGLMLMQYRLNYFGTVFMLSVPWFALAYVPAIQGMKRSLVGACAVLIFLVGFRPALVGPLLNEYPVAGSVLYETVQPLMPAMAEACEEDPGIVLAAGQFGHQLSFHTDCSVIANNFLFSDFHFMKVQEVNELFRVPADVLANAGSPIKYIFVMLADTHELVDGVTVLKDLENIEQRNPRLIRDLVFRDELPDGIESVKLLELMLEDGSSLPLAGVYKLTN
ncbi:MAG: hypothetical protein QNJ05_02110 [Woeseiaceae bacterium]|nr:hypothetical protein [Woeseiaceae bacterium]